MGRDLILASSSPRRRDLLMQMGISFTIHSETVDEYCLGEPNETVAIIARRKADAVQRLISGKVILSADTLVFAKGQVLGKPRDIKDACSMLRILSGGWHEVYTGVCVMDSTGNYVQEEQVLTHVCFEALSDHAIERYAATGEPLDKAGAYGIQGMAGMFVSSIKGSYSNVIGLPISTVRTFLNNLGWQL